MTILQLAATLGVAKKTIERWVKLGLPRQQVDGVYDYDLPAVRAWRQTTTKTDQTLSSGPYVTGVVKNHLVSDLMDQPIRPPDRMKLPVIPALSVPAGPDGRQQLISRLLGESRALLASLLRPLSVAEKAVEQAKTPAQRLQEANVQLAQAGGLHGQALALGAVGGNNRWGTI